MADTMHPLARRANQLLNQTGGDMAPMSADERSSANSERDANTGILPYIRNALGRVANGLTQVIETPYNIMNRAPQLVNLLPGEQGVGTNDELAAALPPGKLRDVATTIFPGKDPLIDAVAKYYPGMGGVGGINQPNPEYPITNHIAEDVGAGVGTMGAGALMTGAKGLAGTFGKYLGEPLLASPVRSVAGQVAGAAGAEGGRQVADYYNVENPLGRFALEMAGSMTPTGITDMAEAGARKLLAREGAGDSLKAMDRLGIQPSIGMTGNRMGAQLESGASSLPFLSAIPEKVREQQFNTFDTKLREAANSYRPGGAPSASDPMSLGEQVRDIASGGASRLRAQFGQREDDLMNAIGARTPISVANTRQTIMDMIPRVDPEMQGALKNELKMLDDMVSQSNPGTAAQAADTVPYEQFRSWRTNVGRRTDQPSIQGGQSKQLYSAITKDLQNAADQAGKGDEFRSLMADQAKAHDPVSGDIPRMESITDTPNNIERGTQYLTSALKNPEKMTALKNNAKPEEWANLTGNIVEHLGYATKGNQNAAGDLISPNKFLANWADMDPRVKNMLFDDNLGTRQTLDDLALVAEDFKRRGLEANTSRTAGTGQAAQAITSVGGVVGTALNPALTLGAGGLTYATVKALMSQTLARWAANQGTSLVDKTITQGITAVPKATNDRPDPAIRKRNR